MTVADETAPGAHRASPSPSPESRSKPGRAGDGTRGFGVHRIGRRPSRRVGSRRGGGSGGAVLLSLGLAVGLVLAGPAVAADTTTPVRAADFLATIGVNIHMAYTDTAYTRVDTVKRALDYLGVSQVRNRLQSTPGDPAGNVHLDRLAAAGPYRFVFIADDPDLPHAMAWLDLFSGEFPGRIIAVEGPNEVDNWPLGYAGLKGLEAAVAYQRDLYAAVHADPDLAGVPVYALTGLGRSWTKDLSDIMDFANEHPYARNGASPSARLAEYVEATRRQVAPKRPGVVTETGYPTLVGHPDIKFGRDGVSEDVQERYTLDTLLDFGAAGIAKTFLYELLDEKPDPDGMAIEQHYGLFTFGGEPKRAATGLHNLTQILSDPGLGAADFTVRPASVAISGLPRAGASMLLAKSDGSLQVAVWAAPPIWNGSTGAAVTPPAASVKVSFGGGPSRLRVYDPTVGTAPLATTEGASDITVTVTDHPVIVDAGPARP